MDDLITIIAFMLGVPFCGIVLALTAALMFSLAGYVRRHYQSARIFTRRQKLSSTLTKSASIPKTANANCPNSASYIAMFSATNIWLSLS